MLRYVRARIRAGISPAVLLTGVLVIVAALAATGAVASQAAEGEPVATTTTLDLRADGTGTVRTVVADGSDPVNYVDLWVDATWLQAFTRTRGEALIE